MTEKNTKISRNKDCKYLFDLIEESGSVILAGLSFERLQEYLGITPENYSKVDDNRYLMLI